jgi:hypothetical protein
MTRCLRQLAAAGSAAVLAGVLVAGFGGRLAMSLLAARNPQATGLTTDDGFTIGQVTFGGTVALLLATCQLALVAAVIYLVVRPLLVGPPWLRAATAAVGGGLTMGALLVNPNTLDFTALDPPLLPVVLFVAIPVVHLAAFAALAEHWMSDGSWFMRGPQSRVRATLAVWLVAGIALLLVLPMIAIWAWALRVVHARPPKPSTAAVLTWVGRATLVAIFLGGVADLSGDISTTLEA